MRFFALLLAGVPAFAAQVSVPVAFEPNRGQAPAPAEFIARGPGYSLSLHGGTAEFRSRGSVLVQTPLAARSSAPQPEGQLPGTSSYLKGRPSDYLIDLPTFRQVRYRNLYSGTDLVYYGGKSGLEYDFVLAPGADPRRIRLSLQGASLLSISAAGDLIARTPGGEFIQKRPDAYQEVAGLRRTVPVRYVLSGSTIRFQTGAYDRRFPLVIDPTLTWAGFTGTAQNTVFDDAQSIALDPAGNVYVCGTTISSAGDDDAFVVKMDPNGAVLKRVSIGGEGDDDPYSLAADSTGAVYVVGVSSSVRWQITSVYAGMGADAFYAKIDPGFTSYVYAGFYGGNGTDVAFTCALDASNNLYFGGATNSTTFPISGTVPQSIAGGGYDGFWAKLDGNGNRLFATYLGGSGDDYLYSLVPDAAGNVYVTGQTGSTNLPVTSGVFQSSPGGGVDAFVARYAASGSLAWLSYLGGSGDDEANGIAVDAAGSAVVTGGTASTNFPTASPYQGTSAGGAHDAFVTRVSADGAQLTWSTYLGGSGDDIGNSVVLDASGNPYIGGSSTSTNFPVAFSWQSTNRGGVDATVTELSADGATLMFSSYMGGMALDNLNSMAMNCTAGLVFAGSSQSTNFPSTLGTAPALAYSQGAAIGYVAKVAAGTSSSNIAAGGIVNAATGSATAVAPGSLVSIYGTNLAGATGSASSTPLPTTLNGVTVSVNGANVPLVYVSPGQINFQLPFEAATGTASATVTAACGPSSAVTFPVASAAPYILLNGSDAVVVNQDGTVNTAANAAPKGTIVTVYLIGIGPLDKQIATGASTPVDLYNAQLPYKALIGGFDTSVKFLGMTPGFVGLAQANLEIPNLSPGRYPIVITVNGVDSNAATMYVK